MLKHVGLWPISTKMIIFTVWVYLIETKFFFSNRQIFNVQFETKKIVEKKKAGNTKFQF